MNTNLNASDHYRCIFVLNSDTKLTFLFSLIALIHSLRFLGQSNMMQMYVYVHVCGHYELLGQCDPLLLLLLLDDRYMHSFSRSYEHLYTQYSIRTLTLCI